MALKIMLNKNHFNTYRSVIKIEQYFVVFLAIFCFFISLTAYSEEILKGDVINIVDGDTLDVQVGLNKYRIRLAEIDAPEKNQPWGHEAKHSLASKILKKEVHIIVTDKDRYGRQIGRIFIGQTDINRSMILEGHAWAYRQYLQNKNLIEVETKARQAGIGLWHSSDAIPPWDWRRGKRNNLSTVKKAKQSLSSNSVRSPKN